MKRSISGIVLFLALASFPYSISAQACSTTIGAPSCVAQSDPGATKAGYLPSPYVANPVDVVSGNKYQHSDDYLAFGSRLQFSRHYNSAASEDRGVLGAGWRHSFDVSLKRASSTRLLLKQSDGRVLEFLADENSATTYRARHAADGYVELATLSRWNLSDGRVLTFKGSYLVEVAYPDKHSLKLKYENNRLESVTDHFKRSIKLEYYSGKQTLGSYDESPDGDSPGYLRSLELPDGSRVNYQYDNLQNLVAVSYPEGTQSLYQYKDADFSHHMTGAYEALESTQKHWRYDQYGRAIQHTNEAAEFTVDVTFAPASDQQTQQRTKVATSDGWKAEYVWRHSSRLNLPHVTDYQEQACATCEPTQQQFSEKSIVDWQPLAPVPRQDDEALDFVASTGSLGGVLRSQSRAKYQVTVDRIGKIRDLSDGQYSLSQLKRSLLNPAALNPTLPQSPIKLCGNESCSGKATKLLNVYQSASQRFSIPTINNPANQALNNRFCAAPTYRNCDQLKHDYQMAQLSSCVYDVVPCGNGYVKVDPARFKLSKLDFERDGFKATLYESPNGELVLAFRGSREEKIDWQNNVAQGKGEHSKFYEQGKNLAEKLDRIGVKIHMTGHSLGGGLASAAALYNDMTATIFNSASVHPNTVPLYWQKVTKAEKHIVTYTVEDDLLSDLQDITPPMVVDSKNNNGLIRATLAAVGQRIVLDNPSKQWLKQYKHSLPSSSGVKDFLSQRKGVLLHSMSAVLEALKNKVLAQCKTLT